jgi:hypothetical protein
MRKKLRPHAVHGAFSLRETRSGVQGYATIFKPDQLSGNDFRAASCHVSPVLPYQARRSLDEYHVTHHFLYSPYGGVQGKHFPCRGKGYALAAGGVK